MAELKEPWQMTRAEYESAYGKPKKTTTVTGGFSPHKQAVNVAINQGKPVPAEVLKDYPDLSNPVCPPCNCKLSDDDINKIAGTLASKIKER